ncbi:hypothetical protein CFC21_106575 [Triticum aestivum]|uniref:Disease resistance protein At4g27190-like leucine-rich repeats domain-containing protein n=2 Tax=Triticum aestivum TaxID=4565 RepID=A0A3B6TGW3_WHEAT|nr:uncharacterized protein LOC123170300 [Triticum aestivum]KAF7105800.1 hypothetical protein CFC21_106575 [Triticum aestivum]
MTRGIELKVNTIDAAAGEILGILDGISKHERNIYFYGWCCLGASAALRVAAQRLKSQAAKGRKFDKVVHVDCTLWQSMRALQKAVAEELELSQSVMAIFDQHDEEDDFNGIDQGSRGVILDVREEIFRKLAGSTFVVFFHNGSNHYIDLYACGVPVTTFLSNKVVWTWGGGFHLPNESLERQLRNNVVDVFVGSEEWHDHVLHEEAAEVAKRVGILDPDKIVECFQYAWARRLVSDIDWEMHASNYWVSDGIIQGQGDTSAWEVGNALKRNVHLDRIVENIYYEKEIGGRISSPNGCWVSATHQTLLHDDNRVLPPRATSFFLLTEESEGRRVVLPAAMFPHNNRLRVLHLSWCTFSFTSPPFFFCSHLRFLLLDHCTDVREEKHQSNNQSGSCIQKLWVLDLRYTDWYSKTMMCLMDELRELNVETDKDWMSIVDRCGNRTSLVKLRVATDTDSATEIVIHCQVPNLSSASLLKEIILEDCVGLEQVVPDVLPPLLESFSFFITDDAIPKISSISLEGLAKLKSVLLRGVMENLQELDLSGTAVKTLDLRKVVALNLKKLILLGCEKLQTIQHPSSNKWPRRFEVLRIDTIRSASSAQANWEEKTKETIAAIGSSCIAAVPSEKPATSFDWYISVRDARLFRSLEPFEKYFTKKCGCIEMASSPTGSVAIDDSGRAQGIRKPGHYLYARDIIFRDHLLAATANEGAIGWMWACSSVPAVDEFVSWYVHIQDEEEIKSGLLQQQGNIQGTSTGVALIPDFICYSAITLRVHDSLSITSIPSPQVLWSSRFTKSWSYLRWCRVERCPKLSSVFPIPTRSDDGNDYEIVECFSWLTTFRASQLLKARYIWNWSTTCIPSKDSFQRLKFLHLDYCPGLIHVLPLSVNMTTLGKLETLEIVCCGDLMEIFPLDPERQEKQTIINFPELKHIHLHDLPKLQRICGSTMLAQKLETIKTRGCWSLRRLPAVAKQCPEVDCEKEWWDSLEWDEGDANHRPSLYKLSHSRYYKKAQLPRGTVLR